MCSLALGLLWTKARCPAWCTCHSSSLTELDATCFQAVSNNFRELFTPFVTHRPECQRPFLPESVYLAHCSKFTHASSPPAVCARAKWRSMAPVLCIKQAFHIRILILRTKLQWLWKCMWTGLLTLHPQQCRRAHGRRITDNPASRFAETVRRGYGRAAHKIFTGCQQNWHREADS